jgi:4-hydroxy-4-methyl-2-oxoglutarate aldolase
MTDTSVQVPPLSAQYYAAFKDLSPTTLADFLSRDRIMDPSIRPLWQGMPRIAGPAYTVRCRPGDNLMLHAAIYRAPAGSVVVVETGDANYALAGGNVCAVAQRNGIAGFVLDGAVRDIAEIRASGFPVFARGVVPIAGVREFLGSLGTAIACGGVNVAPLDVIVADEEGIVVVPCADRERLLESARARAAEDSAQSLDAWEEHHRKRIFDILRSKGFNG